MMASERRVDAAATATDDDDWESGAVPLVGRMLGDDAHMAQAMRDMQNLRLMAPPPAQDGGAFDQRAGFGAEPSDATTVESMIAALDPVLSTALENARDRLTLLKLEDQIVRFLKSPREAQLNFPPLSSYHRLIVHRLADRCGLEHQTAEFSTYLQPNESNGFRVVTLFKTPHTAIPRVLLIDLSAEMQPATPAPASVPKIMIRKRNAAPGGANKAGGGRGNSDAKSQQRSIEDRERAYAEARARIFGEDASAETADASAGSPTKDDGQASRSTAVPSAPGKSPASIRDRSGTAPKEAKARQQLTTQVASASSKKEGRTGGPNGSPFQPHQNWKESKVLWRNREQELNDPDFARHQDVYRGSREATSPYHNGGGRFGSASPAYFYDGSRSYGYQGAAQPPYPGRGRGAAPHEFARVDPLQPPPPPSEYHRYPASAPSPHTTPSYSQYSPSGRPGYRTQPPPSFTAQPRRVAAPSSSGYNDEFPPLGK